MKKLYGVIGDPVAHSMSPVMHNDLFELYSIDATYVAFHVKPDDLEDAVKGFKAIGLSGLSVTVPHKQSIMSFLDEIDPLAQAIGAVNTVVNENGRLVGYNTDGSGYLEGIKKEVPSFADKEILLIGAGGAARGIYFTLAQAGLKNIDIANRTTPKADYLVENCPYPRNSQVLNLEEAEEQLAKYDLIVQTTSIGMHPDVESSPISVENLRPTALVSDIIYSPLETKIMREAKRKGARTQNGIPMFAYQGALQFEKWTGIFPDIERMQSVCLKQLGGKKC
ncbi:shikimate dehydrogenase [Niallia sp. Krafla_26]|uniref:shikimate dehydrogenase n=1 Tax=Niallia sp. Krafla_26 TaxID=3064703 RepID=UPI003D173B51